MARYVYGPVPSRRLGRSLGLDIVTPKSCTVNCVYCQIGSREPLPPVRKRFIDPEIIETELEKALHPAPELDWITFSGSGEPTLSSDLGRFIRFAKGFDAAPICVLTNGTLLWQERVREELAAADLVVPNLDAADNETFQRIVRPHRDIDFDSYYKGLKAFSREFDGDLHLEIVLVRGINDSEKHLKMLARRVEDIDPDGIWIGTVTRPPAENFASPVSEKVLTMARKIIGHKATIIDKFRAKGPGASVFSELTDTVVELLKRRPETIEDMSASLSANPHEITKVIGELLNNGKIVRKDVGGKIYFDAIRDDNSTT